MIDAMLASPWLSVVMPVHRGGEWLGEALASIPSVDEAGCGVEVIIRDSTPEGPCLEPIAPHRERLNIDYAYMPEVASWTRKTNIGVSRATAPYTCTLHQDDLWLDGRVECIRTMISQFPEAALLVTPARLVDSEGKGVGQWRPPFRPGFIDTEHYRDLLLVQNTIAMPAPVFRRDAYLAAGGLDESLWYTPDWDLWFKLADQGDIAYDVIPTTAFRLHSASQTMTGSRKELAEQLEIVRSRYNKPERRTQRIGKASVKINIALAEAAAGQLAALVRALKEIINLGPSNAIRYLRYSSFIDRVLPRLRLRLRGNL
jgi:hypothetical protein